MTQPSKHQATKPSRHTPSSLPAKLEKHLSAYAIAASSAGVALLACAQPSEAKIVFTKTNIVVPIGGGVVQFDINHDGQPDFGLSEGFFPVGKHRKSCTICSFGGTQLNVVPAQPGNEVWQAGTFYGNGSHHGRACAADVAAGIRIGPLRPFGTGKMYLFNDSLEFSGPVDFCPWQSSDFSGVTHKPYLGVKFLDTAGKVHYGWVRNSANPGGMAPVIQGYAYETTPNTPIVAGQTSGADASTPVSDFTPVPTEPAGLGRLAQGSAGLAAWRK